MLIERLERVALFGSAWVLYLLMGLSLWSVGAMLERWAYFRKHHDRDVLRLGDEVVAHLKKGDNRAADQLLAVNPSIEAAVVRKALGWLEGGPAAVDEALHAAMGKKRSELERGLTLLGTLGNNAPFIGLLGTVLGVIQAFHQLGEGQSKAAMGNVMSGIAEALIATGVGLVVALPAVVAYNIIQKKVSDVESNVSVIGRHLLAHLRWESKLSGEMNALQETQLAPSFPPSMPPLPVPTGLLAYITEESGSDGPLAAT